MLRKTSSRFALEHRYEKIVGIDEKKREEEKEGVKTIFTEMVEEDGQLHLNDLADIVDTRAMMMKWIYFAT